jgi:hypothetical protein
VWSPSSKILSGSSELGPRFGLSVYPTKTIDLFVVHQVVTRGTGGDPMRKVDPSPLA